MKDRICPLCGTAPGAGCLCPACGWDLSSDPELYPTLFSAAGAPSRTARDGEDRVRMAEAEKERLFVQLGRLLFDGLEPEQLQACLKAEDPKKAAQALLARDPPQKPPKKAPVIRGDWRKNILTDGAFDRTAFRKVRIIRFQAAILGFPENTVDLSRDGDGSVIAYLSRPDMMLTLTVCGEGGIRAPELCTSLFYDLPKLQSIDFGGCFHTEDCRNMAGMFKGCTALKSLDLSGFDTSRVTDMSRMFYGCSALSELDLSSFDTARVRDMSYMFFSCRSLRRLKLGARFDLDISARKTYMFYGCSALDNPPIPELSIS